MEEGFQTQAVVQVEPAAHGAEDGLMSVSAPMMTLTWVSFLIVAALLYKVAWKPILTALDLRESGIRKALENAEKARREALASEERNRKLIQDAEVEAHRIIVEARSAAEACVRQLHEDAARRAKELTEEAQRDIACAIDQARQSLRGETAEMVIKLSSKVLAGTVDPQKSRQLIQDALREVPK
jgi:F-type H+-transporting ATPase subunit b